MRPLLLVLLLAPAAFAATAPAPQADWRAVEGVDDRVKAALTGRGWRFEADGRALDPKTKKPADTVVFAKAVADLRADARRAALEAVNLMLAKPALDDTDRARLATLSADLPPNVVKALNDPKSLNATLRRMVDSELGVVAAYFDGSRSLDDRRAAAAPVKAVPTGDRVPLPYFTAQEKAVGDKLKAGWISTIGKDPVGKTVLSRLAGKDGKPDLPPIVIERQDGDAVAHYDPRRAVISVSRDAVLDSVTSTIAPSRRAALRESLADDAALQRYLDLHPEALGAVVRDNDVVIVHELTHAWQDRRETVLRETARGNLPDSQLIEYEVEAYTTKNLYIHSKLKNDPASVVMDTEFDDYLAMMDNSKNWRDRLVANLKDSSPSRALSSDDVKYVMNSRITALKKKKVSTKADQEGKALDLAALTRAQREFGPSMTQLDSRLATLRDQSRIAESERNKYLGVYFLGKGLNASSPTERSVLLAKAQAYAIDSKDPKLIEEVRRARAEDAQR